MLELLESRIAPAGIVNVVIGTGLSISVPANDTDAQEITVNGTLSGGYLITPDAGTQLKIGSNAALAAGVPAMVAGVSGDIIAKLGGGDDRFIFEAATAPNNLCVEAGNGNDRVILGDASVGAKLKVTGGNGDDVLEFRGTSVHIAKTVLFTAGNGSNELTIKVKDFFAASHVAYLGGNGTDAVQLDAGSCDTVSIGGSLNVDGGPGNLNIQLAPANFLSVQRGGSISAGAGEANVTFGSSGHVNLGRSFSFSMAAAKSNVSVGASATLFVAGSLVFLGGADSDDFSVTAGSVYMSGGIHATLGAGDNNANFSMLHSTVAGVKVIGGVGNDTFYWFGGGIVKSMSALIGTGSGAQSIQVAGAGHGLFIGVLVASTYGATGSTTVTLDGVHVQSAANITTGGGNDLLKVDNSAFAKFTAFTGAGADSVEIERAGTQGVSIFSTTATQFQLGDGDDTVTIGTSLASGFVTFGFKWKLIGGDGSDTGTIDATVSEPNGRTAVSITL